MSRKKLKPPPRPKQSRGEKRDARRQACSMSAAEKRALRLQAERRWEATRACPARPSQDSVVQARAALLAPPTDPHTKKPACGVVRWFAGGGVGTDAEALAHMGGLDLLQVDIRPEYLEWDGSTAVRWQQSRRDDILQQIRDHDFTQGPFKLAASVRKGFYVPGLEYDLDVGTFRRCKPEDPKSDQNRILQVLRERFPHLKLVLLASPPCRMTSNCNSTTGRVEKQEFLQHILHSLRGLRYALEFGKVDTVLVEESAKGTHDRHGVFVPGDDARRMLAALNCVDDGAGDARFGVVRLDAAADFGGPSTRQRLLFAPKNVLAAVPARNLDACAHQEPTTSWGLVLGVPEKHGILRTVRGSWLPRNFAGCHPSDAGGTLTTLPMFMYAERHDMPQPTLVGLGPVDRALWLGCRPNDPRLPRLLHMSQQLSNTLTGISFAADFYLGVLAAAMGTLGCLDGAAGARRAFWSVQRDRRALHRQPVRGQRVKRHNFLADLHEGMTKEEYHRRLARLHT